MRFWIYTYIICLCIYVYSGWHSHDNHHICCWLDIRISHKIYKCRWNFCLYIWSLFFFSFDWTDLKCTTSELNDDHIYLCPMCYISRQKEDTGIYRSSLFKTVFARRGIQSRPFVPNGIRAWTYSTILCCFSACKFYDINLDLMNSFKIIT